MNGGPYTPPGFVAEPENETVDRPTSTRYQVLVLLALAAAIAERGCATMTG